MADKSAFETVDELYEIAHKAMPRKQDGSEVQIDVEDGRLVAGLLNFFLLHVQATEVAVKKLAHRIDQLEK